LQLIKDNYRVVLKNSKFKKWNFLDKRYFLSFLYIIWYKNIFFLTYFVWTSFNKLKNKEKRILKTTFLFLNSFPLAKIGIIGFKLLIKGKLFKRPRRKKKLIKKGRVPLLNPLYYIIYNKYLIITRAGLFSFHIWVTFFK
jgi:hypothetical protein